MTKQGVCFIVGLFLRKTDDDWVNKCIELKAEDRLDDQEEDGWTV